MHFGYPFCTPGDFLDSEFRQGTLVQGVRAADREAGRSYRAARHALLHREMFPPTIATTSSSRCTLVEPFDEAGLQRRALQVDAKGNVKLEPFLEGFLDGSECDPPMWGRPVDVLQMKDGALLVSDDYNGVVYRISYGK